MVSFASVSVMVIYLDLHDINKGIFNSAHDKKGFALMALQLVSSPLLNLINLVTIET